LYIKILCSVKVNNDCAAGQKMKIWQDKWRHYEFWPIETRFEALLSPRSSFFKYPYQGFCCYYKGPGCNEKNEYPFWQCVYEGMK